MKHESSSFAFSKREIKVLRVIADNQNVSIHDISSRLGKSEGPVSQTIKNLEKKGIVEVKRAGMRKLVAISDRNYAVSLSEMIRAEPYIPWENVLSDSNLPVLFKNVVGERSFGHNISTATSWRVVRNLSALGMNIGPHTEYLSKNRNLVRFINEYADYVSMKYIKEEIPSNAIILWRRGYRCLFKVRGTSSHEDKSLSDGTFPTSLTVSPYYELKFITEDSYYYHDPKLTELTIEDVILHTLLIDPDSQTYASYAILLALKNIKHVDLDLLQQKASDYHLEKTVADFVAYIMSKGKIREWPFPDPNELSAQTNLYGIVVN